MQAMLHSDNGCRELTAQCRANDVLLTVSGTEGFSRSFALSEILYYSQGRPWQLLPLVILNSHLRNASDDRLQLNVHGTPADCTIDLWFDASGLLHMDFAWTWTVETPQDDMAVAVVFDTSCDRDLIGVTMPHILYNNNPSADSERLVPRLVNGPDGCVLLCEEHRFPIPAVQIETVAGTQDVSLTVFSLPDANDPHWSLGLNRTAADHVEMIIASGLCALNGVKDTLYGAQCESKPSFDDYRRAEPGGTIRKCLALDLTPCQHKGHGFKRLSQIAWDLYGPTAKAVLTPSEVIDLKCNALDHIFRRQDQAVGYLCVLPGSIYKSPPYFLWGWTGQNFRLAWCDAAFGFMNQQSDRIDRVCDIIDFYIAGSATDCPGLRYNYYYLDDRRWTGLLNNQKETTGISSRAHGEAIVNLCKILSLFKAHDYPIKPEWLAAVNDAAGFFASDEAVLPQGVYPRLWNNHGRAADPKATASGISAVIALCRVHALTGDPSVLIAATERMERYVALCGEHFEHPYAGATLDAYCEDKEAALAFFMAADELFALTGNTRWRDQAMLAAEWMITFVYHWHTGFRPGTICANEGFVTTGWPGVSVQNHHLDVFFPVAELAAFGRAIGCERYVRIADMVRAAWSHGIAAKPGQWEHDIPGMQGEQFFQTNYYQGPFDASYYRGGYNRWNPSWIISLVLEAYLAEAMVS